MCVVTWVGRDQRVTRCTRVGLAITAQIDAVKGSLYNERPGRWRNGRRSGLKIRRGETRVGSNPTRPTCIAGSVSPGMERRLYSPEPAVSLISLFGGGRGFMQVSPGWRTPFSVMKPVTRSSGTVSRGG